MGILDALSRQRATQAPSTRADTRVNNHSCHCPPPPPGIHRGGEGHKGWGVRHYRVTLPGDSNVTWDDKNLEKKVHGVETQT